MQRTPLVSRVNNNANIGMQSTSTWAPRLNPTHNHNPHSHSHNHSSKNRQQLPTSHSVNPPRTNSISDGSDNGTGLHSRPSKLSTLASHNSWPNNDPNIPKRGEHHSIMEDPSVTRSPKPNPREDSDLLPSTAPADDERWIVSAFTTNRQVTWFCV